MISKPNTTIYPWAMVIHFKYTCSADLTVMRSWRFYSLAYIANARIFFLLLFLFFL
jgi:hypothetical protein